MRGMTMSGHVTLVVEECFTCGAPFAMTQDFRDSRLRDRTRFFCPAGHSQVYSGKTDAEKLEEEKNRSARLRAQNDQLAASNQALRGVATRRRNELERVKGGVCPVKGCRRHFTNLERHLRGQHPGYVEAHL